MCLSFQFIRQSRVNFAHYQVILRKRSQEKLASVPYKPYITNALKQEANLLIMKRVPTTLSGNKYLHIAVPRALGKWKLLSDTDSPIFDSLEDVKDHIKKID